MSIAYCKLKPSKAEKICEEAISKVKEWISDPIILRSYSSSMKGLERVDLLEKMWEKIVQLYPSIANYESLFSAYILSKNTEKQISTATQCWKLSGQDKHFMWSIVARTQFYLKKSVEKQPNIVLKLAQTMIETKFLKTNKLKSQSEFMFLLNLMVLQNQSEDSIKLIQSELAKQVIKIDTQRFSEEAALLLRFGKFEQANLLYQTLIKDFENDEWSWYLGLIDSAISSEQIEKLGLFLNSVGETKTKSTSAFLAKLELEKRISIKNQSFINVEHFLVFFDKFSSKPSCFRDLVPYFDYLSKNEYEVFFTNLKSKIPQETQNDSSLEKTNRIYSIINYEGIIRCLSSKLKSTNEIYQKVNYLKDLYLFCLSLDLPLRESTQRFCGDDLILLTSHYLVDAFILTKNMSYLVVAAAILEEGLTKSEYNFQFRLFLNEIYLALNASKSSMDQFEKLEIKNIQLDSMSHYFTDGMVRLANLNDLKKILKKSSSFYDESLRTTGDFIFEAYKNAAYNKVEEISNFDLKINQSLNKLALLIETTFWNLAETSSIESILEDLNLTFLPDSFENVVQKSKNYDYKVMDHWEINKDSPVLINENFEIIRSCTFPDSRKQYLQERRIYINALVLRCLKILKIEKKVEQINLKQILSDLKDSISLIANSVNNFEIKIFEISYNLISIISGYSFYEQHKNESIILEDISLAISGFNSVLQTIKSTIGSFDIHIISFLICKPVTIAQWVLNFILNSKTNASYNEAYQVIKKDIQNLFECIRNLLSDLDKILASFQYPEFETVKIISEFKFYDNVIKNVKFSRKDTLLTLSSLIKNKLKEIKSF